MQDTIDLLQIKIEKAKAQLPEDTLNAINAIDWRAVIMDMRAKKGYTFEQLEDLDIETELLLCGLLRPEDYPKELENRMKISKMEAIGLVNEMNDLVFKKIREEFIKNTERKKIFKRSEKELLQKGTLERVGGPTEKLGIKKDDIQVFKSAGIEIIEPTPPNSIPKNIEVNTREDILKKVENPDLLPKAHPILVQKLSGSYKTPVVKTAHSLDNITKTAIGESTTHYEKSDPYRMLPE